MQSYSLSEFLRVVQLSLRDAFPDTYWIRAEISSLSERGHCYLELVESAADGAVPGTFSAKMRANCWRSTWLAVSARFTAQVGQPLRVGMQVLAEVRVDFHPVYGISLTIEDIDPTFTQGDLARQKAETLLRLEREGIIDMQQDLSLPTLPQRLAIISSPSAAGYQDCVHQLINNGYGFAFRTTLYDAVMQGDTAPQSVINALTRIWQDSEAGARFDAVIIIRGGGATTDLSCFDDYLLAAHCAQFPLPIIAGIGHTRDISVVDRVSHISVKTPTAAAELLISMLLDQQSLLDQLSERLNNTAARQVQLRRQMIDRLEMRLNMSLKMRLQKHRQALDLIERTITLHSPERIFRLGYSLTLADGKVVRSAAELRPGQHIITKLQDGTVESEVL